MPEIKSDPTNIVSDNISKGEMKDSRVARRRLVAKEVTAEILCKREVGINWRQPSYKN